jgi:hypothetical protein
MKFAPTQILGRLRRQTFFSLEEASDAIKLALERMNNHIMRRLGVSCSDLFASIERPALGALPAARHEYAEWRLVRVSIDYHVEVDHFLCSAHLAQGASKQQRRSSWDNRCSVTAIAGT